MAARLPEEIRPVMDNGIPAVMVTCSAAGVPNTTVISQVYYVDETHVALSFQFFNKTIRNMRENPRANVTLGHPGFACGSSISSSTTRKRKGRCSTRWTCRSRRSPRRPGCPGIFKLRAADIYRVLAVEKQPYQTPAA